jgi:hypothetical protein
VDEQEFSVDFTSDVSKRRLWAFLKGCRGKWRITAVRWRQRRTDRQNRYYWPAFVTPFLAYLNEENGESHTKLSAHEILKGRFLRSTFIHKETGEAFDFTRSTTDLSTGEFNNYLDQCAAFLAEYCGIIVPEPSEYHEREAALV